MRDVNPGRLLKKTGVSGFLRSGQPRWRIFAHRTNQRLPSRGSQFCRGAWPIKRAGPPCPAPFRTIRRGTRLLTRKVLRQANTYAMIPPARCRCWHRHSRNAASITSSSSGE